MNRTQIYLDPAHQQVLRAVAAERSTTISQVIREAIADWVARYRKPKTRFSEGLRGIIGIYRDDTDREGSVRHDDIYD